VTDDYQMTGRWELDYGYGLLHLGGKKYMVTFGLHDEETGHGGGLQPAVASEEGGLEPTMGFLAPPMRKRRR
jgi:hypothetical protein